MCNEDEEDELSSNYSLFCSRALSYVENVFLLYLKKYFATLQQRRVNLCIQSCLAERKGLFTIINFITLSSGGVSIHSSDVVNINYWYRVIFLNMFTKLSFPTMDMRWTSQTRRVVLLCLFFAGGGGASNFSLKPTFQIPISYLH